ncbi:MAG: type IV pilus twitching motility protein PilT [Candidatus Dormibacteria bacterium]
MISVTGAQVSDEAAKYIEGVIQRGASDLLLTAGAPPTVRVNGELTALFPETMSATEVSTLVRSFVPPERLPALDNLGEVDFSINWMDRVRFRANAFNQRGSLALALRLIPYAIPSMGTLRLPHPAAELAKLRQGLILVTGPTGSGKTTTMASMIDWINQNRACHIVTIEDPVEYVHRHSMAIVDQREVGIDTKSFSSALRAALRQDPDVVLVGEMRDLETIRTAVTVAETGHLVLATLHTNDTGQAIDRIIDVFPGEQQQQIKLQLAHTLAGVIYQQLLPTADGNGRVAAFEVLLASTAIRNLVREGNTRQVRNVLATSMGAGMQTLERSLGELVADGTITYDEAVGRSLYPGEIRSGASPVEGRKK